VRLLCAAGLALLSSAALPASAAQFQNGQAARAVIGQPSFSARDTGVTPMALSLSNGRLYVADASNHLLAFDLSQLPGARDDFAKRQSSGCAVCLVTPAATLNQSVIPGIAAVSVFGKSIAIADTVKKRVLVWRDASSEAALKGPDVILGGAGSDAPISASTLVEPISVALDGSRLFVGDGTLHRVLVWNGLPQSNNQPADAVLGQQNFNSSALADSPTADSIARPVALESDGTNLFVADSANRRVLIFTAADVPLPSGSLVNSASLSGDALAPATLITISAAGLTQSTATAPDDTTQPLPKTLGGVEAVLDGEALPLLSVSPSEIRAQLPFDIANRSSASFYLRSESGDGSVLISNAISVNLLPVAPGLFAFSGQEPRPGMSVHAQGAPVTGNSPAHPGETITLWAAGLGSVVTSDSAATLEAGVPNPQPDAPVRIPVSATINGMPAQVVSAALPQGSIGIYELHIVLPANLPDHSAALLAISQDGRQSNSVTIPVQSTIQ